MTQRYSPPAVVVVPNKDLLPKPFEQAWNDLVRNLTVTYFRIHQVSKDSRIINLEFESRDPSRVIDCGRVHRTIVYKGTPATVNGVVNVYVSPVSAAATEIEINVRYTFTKHLLARQLTQRQSGQYLFERERRPGPRQYVFTTA